MSNNGTDRDIALNIVSALNAIETAIIQINDKEFVPHILTQPDDFVGEVGVQASFSVVANNVSAYQWQLKLKTDSVWNNASVASAKTATLTLTISEAYYDYEFRCKITGKDNSTIYTNAVTIYQSEPEG